MTDGEKPEQQHESADAAVLGRFAGIVGALAATVACIYTVAQDGLPESTGEIVLAAGFIVFPLVALAALVNHHLASEDKRPLMSRNLGSLFAFAVVAFAITAGVLAGLDRSAGKAASTAGSNAYAKELRRELQRLRSASGLAYSANVEDREAYAEEAQDLAELYGEASKNLSVVAVPHQDRVAHLRLVGRLADVGDAYENLATVALERPARKAEIEAARDRVRAAAKAVKAAEEGLERQGYQIVIPAG